MKRFKHSFAMAAFLMIGAAQTVTADAATIVTRGGQKETKSAKSELFSAGLETFVLKDPSGKSPTFRLLADTPTEKALALAVIASLNVQPEVEPKIPVTQYLDVKIENMTLAPVEGDPASLSVGFRVSGHDVVMKRTVSREQFMAGKPIQLDFPKEERQVSFFTVEHGGKLRFRLDPARKIIVIENALGEMDFDSTFAGGGSESIRFTAQGIRRI